jgi:addiction module HigA family antidote
MKAKKLNPVHPGEVLSEDFMKPAGLSQYRLADSLGVPAIRISQIIRGQRGISADTALRLARYFGTSPDVWIGLQARFDLESEQDRIGARIQREVQPRELGVA